MIYRSLFFITLLSLSGCSTLGFQDIRRSKCATRDECHRIARDNCAGAYQIEDIYYGRKYEDDRAYNPGDDGDSAAFAGDVLGSLIGAAATAVFDPTPWTIEFICSPKEDRYGY